MFWISACMQCVWTGSIEIKLSTDIIHARIQKVLSKGIQLWQRLFLKLMAFRWHADECPTLNAGLAAAIFQGIRTCIARKTYMFVIFQWLGSAHIISRYFGTYNVRQRLRRACASVHFQYSIDGSGTSSTTAFMLNGSLILCLTTQTTTWKKAPLYISLYKQTF